MGNKTKEQLIEEIELLRKEVAELEQGKAECARREGMLQAYESMVESAHDAIFFKDLDGRYVMANAKTLGAFGLSREEVIGKNDRELMTNQEEAKKNTADDRLVFKTEKPTEITKHMTGADGKEYWFQAIKVPQFDEEGNIMGLVGIARDITERKRMEEERLAARRRAEETMESMIDGVMIVDFNGVTLQTNSAFERQTGYKKEEVIGKTVQELGMVPAEDFAKRSEQMPEMLKKGYLQNVEEIVTRKDGTKFNAFHNFTVLRDVKGNPMGLIVVTRDITERKKAEERVQHLNLVLRAIRSVNQVIARETDRSQLLKDICRSLTEARGYHNAWIALLDESGELREYAEAGLGDDFLPMKERLRRGELTRCARTALEQFSPIVTENPLVDCSDCPLSGSYKGRGALTTRLQHGARCYGFMSLSIPAELLSDDEEVVLCREVADDIAFALDSLELEEGRNKVAEELEESEERYRALVEAGADMGEAIVLLQNTDKVEAAHLFANQEWVRITGYTLEELREISYFDLIHPRDRDAVADTNRRRLRGEDVPGPWEVSIIAKDGTEVPVEGIGTLITYQGRPAVAGYIRDITERKRAEEEIRKLGFAVEQSIDGIAIGDLEPKLTYVNDAFARMHGYSPEEMVGMKVVNLHNEEQMDEYKKGMNLIKTQGSWVGEIGHIRKDGTAFPTYMSVTLLKGNDGKPTGTLAAARDITERRQAEQALRESEKHFRALIENSSDIIQVVDSEGVIRYVSPSVQWILGYKPEELIGRLSIDVVHPDDLPQVARGFEKALQKPGVPLITVCRCKHKDGTWRVIEGTGVNYLDNPAVNGFISNMNDITERKRAEESLKASLEEKEVLLKEVHHRVKNNLQVISSLLKLQSGYIEEERYAEMFKESQERVKSMALVHEKLYQSEDLARIDFAGYIESMVEELRRSYGSERAGIGIKMEVGNVRLGINYAIPCGLIINELVSNSLKHAFLEGKRGEVRIAMRQVSGDEVELEVSDNGAGIPESVDVRNAKSLGLRLVSILAEDQLGGEMELDRTEGTKFRIRFRVS